MRLKEENIILLILNDNCTHQNNSIVHLDRYSRFYSSLFEYNVLTKGCSHLGMPQLPPRMPARAYNIEYIAAKGNSFCRLLSFSFSLSLSLFLFLFQCWLPNIMEQSDIIKGSFKRLAHSVNSNEISTPRWYR